MVRIISFTAAIVSTALLLSPTASRAAGSANYYAATPMAAPAHADLVVSGIAWSCSGGVCAAGKAPDRDAIVCARVAKSIGKLSAFTAGGSAIDAEALDKCNAHAK